MPKIAVVKFNPNSDKQYDYYIPPSDSPEVGDFIIAGYHGNSLSLSIAEIIALKDESSSANKYYICTINREFIQRKIADIPGYPKV